MNLSRIDLNLFVVFDAIYTQQSLTRAAEVLHVTQPAVSNALGRLRQHLDDPLFIRSGKGMSPTPLARQLIEPIRQALKGLETCVQGRQHFNPATARQTLRLHATEHAEISMLPTLLQQFRHSAPELNLEVVFHRRRDIPLELASGRLQLAVDAPLINNQDLLDRQLCQDRYVCVMHASNPLAKGELTLARFTAARHIHISSRSRGSGHVDLALKAIGHQRRTALRLQHYAALPSLLANSDAIAAVPLSLARDWPHLVQRDLPFTTSPMELRMFWHKSSDHDPVIAWLRDQVVAAAAGATASSSPVSALTVTGTPDIKA